MFEGLFQPLHLLILFVIILLIFGPKNLPALGKGLGESIRSFKQAITESKEEEVASDGKDKPHDEKRS